MSLPYIGGMRHINVLPGSVDQACGEVRNLREDEIPKVLDFISRVKSERGTEENPAGDPKLLTRHVGRFSFNEGERQKLLDMALQAREGGVR
jgi:hypothetical protein